MLITDVFYTGIAAVAIVSLFVVIFQREKLRAHCKGTLYLFILRIAGLWWAITAIALLFKLRIFMHNEQGDPFAAVNWIPFQTIAQYFTQRNWVQLAGNLFVFLPFPILLYFNFPNMKYSAFLLSVLSVIVLIEPVQLLVNVIAGAAANVIDVDDFLLNAAGGLAGLCAAVLLRNIRQKKKRDNALQNQKV